MKTLQAKNCGISCMELYVPKTYVEQSELGKPKTTNFFRTVRWMHRKIHKRSRPGKAQFRHRK